MTHDVIFALWAIAQFVGFGLASYGVLRESFADLAEARPHGEGRFGEGPFGGGPLPRERLLITIGRWSKLLPGDQKLTLTDRKRNAASAVAGIGLLVVSMVVDLVLRVVPSP